jgi:hypothetical protein
MLARSDPGGRFLEIRAIARDRPIERSFVSARQPELAAARITSAARDRDVYVGVALRTTRQAGGKQAIDGSHLAYIECDTPDATHALNDFEHPASMLIASGTPGHIHAYWQLEHRYPSEIVEHTNRQLAAHLHGDPASIDIARILRPPGTLNHKHQPAAPVRLLAHRPDTRYTPAQLTARLPDPHQGLHGHRDTVTAPARDAVDARLRAIPAATYAHALTGRTPDRAGKIKCPFHNDNTPSLQLYPDGTFYCFGCRRGGTIYDFAATLWQMPLRGPAFIQLRDRLAEALDVSPDPAGAAR